MIDKTNLQEPIRLSSFRREATRTRSTCMDRQMRLSFALVTLLLLASATIGLTNFSAPQAQNASARSAILATSARG